ncbi:MAG: DUF5654 family protein [Parcubacteria group bacterium]
MAIIKTKIKKEISGVREEIRNKTVGYIVTALGLVAGLAWNDAVKTLIENFFPAKENTVWAKFIYATVLTIIVVLISLYLVKIFKKEEKRLDKKLEKAEKLEK